MLDFLKIFFYILDVFYFIDIRLFLEGYHHLFVKIYIISAKNIYAFLKIFTKGKSRIFTRFHFLDIRVHSQGVVFEYCYNTIN